jgi:hypothetical protein
LKQVQRGERGYSGTLSKTELAEKVNKQEAAKAEKKAAKPKASSATLPHSAKSYVSKLFKHNDNNNEFDSVIADIRADKSIKIDDMHAIANEFLGYTTPKGTKAKLLQKIIDRQALDARQEARGNAISRGAGEPAHTAPEPKKSTAVRPKSTTAKEATPKAEKAPAKKKSPSATSEKAVSSKGKQKTEGKAKAVTKVSKLDSDRNAAIAALKSIDPTDEHHIKAVMAAKSTRGVAKALELGRSELGRYVATEKALGKLGV